MIADLGIIFAAGGSGRRYQHGNKLFEKIDGVPLFIHSIRNFSRLCLAPNAVIAVPAVARSKFQKYLTQYLPDYPLQVIKGGAERATSVQNGLSALPETVKFVAVHDSARPLSSVELLAQCLEEARICGGAIPGKPVTDTLKQITTNGMITATVPRESFWRAETPQVFERRLLEVAYHLAKQQKRNFTDDAAVMEFAGYQVKMIYNSHPNLKITYQSDLPEIRNM